MPTPTEWLNEFQVNTGTAATGTQSDPKIVGLANGGFVVVWTEATTGLIGPVAGTDIIAKIYDAEGNVVRDAYRLNSSFFADDEGDFDLTATHDGFAIAFIDNSIGNVSQTSVVYQRNDLDGNTVTSVQIADENVAADFLRNPQIVSNLIASNDDIYVAFEDDVGTDTDISARVIDQAGALGAEFGSAQNSNDSDTLGDVAILDNGEYVIVYNEVDSGTTGIEFVIRSETGVAGANVQVATSGTDPAIASLEGGGFVVTYVDGSDVFARVYSNAGSATTSAFAVASGTNIQNEPVVTALKDGDFVVAWDDDTTGNLFARRFNADGSTDGSTFTVENVATTNIDISTSGDGRILFAWQEEFGEIMASIWDPRPTTIDPDDYDNLTENFVQSNVITTGLAGSTVLAGFSTDTVLGQNGDDTIFSSGSGNFSGGGGNDTITAGNGTLETLDGGVGNDTLITTTFAGNYSVDLDSGLTNFGGESFVNFENVTTGIGNDTIVGTNGANLINTGDGDDEVDAGRGNDTINAGAGNDLIIQSSGADVINAGSGNDTVTSSGSDTVFGGSGNDSIFAGIGALENLFGGSGNDTLNTTLFNLAYEINLATGFTNFAGEFFLEFENVVSGGGSDELLGTAVANRMDGGAGNDRILGFAGNDTLIGGLGIDTLNGGDGNDSILAGDGNDSVFAEAGNDTLDGGAGNDLLEGKIGNDVIIGGTGDDTLRGSDGADSIIGGAGNDVAFGGNDNDTIRGGNGNDTLDGSGGNDFIFGDGGNDVLVGENGADFLLGGDGADVLRGRGGNDELSGDNGNDLIFGSAGEDTVFGGAGNDTLEGDTQADELYGNTGNDILRGGDGFDQLFGDNDNDTLVGGNGNDTLEGGAGVDILRGNAQNDTFVFNFASHSSFANSDLIDGIEGVGAGGGDIIDLSGIDANTLAGGNSAFTFLGLQTSAAGLGFGAGALWVENSGGQTRVFGNIDNDNVIELEIRINDGAGISAADYIAGDFLL
ncbi:MAG: calcium-binding protein [Roseobacter sp.]